MAHEAIKQLLEDRMSMMRDRLASIKKDASQAHSGDSAEQAQERENDEGRARPRGRAAAAR